MNGYASRLSGCFIAVVGLALTMTACKDNPTTPSSATSYVEVKLVADQRSEGATLVDADLVNPWGLAFGPTGILWVANNHSGTSTLYDANGAKIQTVVGIPSKDHPTGGSPTGVVYNASSDFMIPDGGKSLFIFAGEDGTVSAWSSGMTNAKVVADHSGSDAVYKGIAMASNAGANYIYLANFKMNTIDMFNASFGFVKSFTDANVPAGYAPFGIHTINGLLYVTFAKQKGPDNEDDESGIGNGYVDIFNPDGSLVKRFASNGSLNSPWAVVMAPANFGTYGGDILIGNFGDGHIGAYDPVTGNFLSLLNDPNSTSIAISGLWDLTFGINGSTTLYFSAGPDDENHGLLGTLRPM